MFLLMLNTIVMLLNYINKRSSLLAVIIGLFIVTGCKKSHYVLPGEGLSYNFQIRLNLLAPDRCSGLKEGFRQEIFYNL